MQTVFITGVSSGIGHGLAAAYLQRGWRVFGISRRNPDDLMSREQFVFRAHDLTDHASTAGVVAGLLEGVDNLDLAVLNAGVLGVFGDLRDADLDDLQQTMDVNVWANKVLLDSLFTVCDTVGQVVTISSGAAVNGNRGWSGYSISKAALNMLTKLCASERPETHFCAFAPGIVDTAMQEELCTRPVDPRFPSVEVLRSRRGTEEMPVPEVAAESLIAAFERLPELVESGEYADIRSLDDAR